MEGRQVIKIVLTGPESSGKSKLTQGLAKYYDTFWVPEYARNYLARLHRPYTATDILQIAKEQSEIQKQAGVKSNPLLICDTGLLVLKIWLQYKYQISDPWIEDQFKKDAADLYLLCRPDIPWEEDPLRENPDNRAALFELYLQALKLGQKSFVVISGADFEKRMRVASAAIDQLLSA